MICTLLKQMLLMVWTTNCVSFNGNAGYSLSNVAGNPDLTLNLQESLLLVPENGIL
jgi:hypothetical protein